MYLSALRAIRSRAAVQEETEIFDQAGKWIDEIGAAAGKKSFGPEFFEHYYGTDQFAPRFVIDAKTGIAKALPMEMATERGTSPIVQKSFTTEILDANVDGNPNIFRLRVTQAKRDRQNDIIAPLGGDVSMWMRPNAASPTGKSGNVFFMHDTDELQVARALSWNATEDYGDVVQEYHTHTKRAQECRDMRRDGFLNESSIDFTPLAYTDKNDPGVRGDGGPVVTPRMGTMVRTYDKWQMLELSDATIGINPYTYTLDGAVRKAVAAGTIRADGEMATLLARATTRTIPSIQSTVPKLKSIKRNPTMGTIAENINKAGAVMAKKNIAHSETADDHMEACKALHKAFGDANDALLSKAQNIHESLRKGEEPDEDDTNTQDVHDALHKAVSAAFPKAEPSDEQDKVLDEEVFPTSGEKALGGKFRRQIARDIARAVAGPMKDIAKSINKSSAQEKPKKVLELN